MKHPEITSWADFARSLVTDGERASMQQHLESGCGLCHATLTALERVHETARADAAQVLPAGALRSVKAFFATQHPEARGFWSELRLRATFDSALAPAPAASRAQSGDRRQLLFESDEYTLELSVDHSPGAVDSVLRGQLLEAHGEPRSHTPVFLVGDGEVIGRTISAQHGTFELAGRLDLPCELWVFPDDRNRIRLSLPPEN